MGSTADVQDAVSDSEHARRRSRGPVAAMVWRAVAAGTCACISPALHAQEAYALGGWMRSQTPPADSYAWTISYTQTLQKYLLATCSWLNEGHFPGHHRDGNATQLWLQTAPIGAVKLAAGAGAYRYFDTVVAENPSGYANDHGWGGIYSVSATYGVTQRIDLQLRADRVVLSDRVNTTSVMLGVGVNLDQDSTSISSTPLLQRPLEATLLTGQTIVNSYSSPKALASSAELRLRLNSGVRFTVAFVNEGDARLIRRNGAVSQLWLEPSFFGDRLSLGVGAGGYYAIDHHEAQGNVHSLSGIVSGTASWNLAQNWVARFTWHRIVSNYDRDSDILIGGFGYRF